MNFSDFFGPVNSEKFWKIRKDRENPKKYSESLKNMKLLEIYREM